MSGSATEGYTGDHEPDLEELIARAMAAIEAIGRISMAAYERVMAFANALREVGAISPWADWTDVTGTEGHDDESDAKPKPAHTYPQERRRFPVPPRRMR